ncbi:type II secretion system protein GspK [Luteolibacter pohnpeiensis]|nr:type II secretion system protein GspK [Luteolibacter pohnpeiensis]
MATLRVISFDMELATSKVHGTRALQIAEMGIAIGCNPSVERDDPLLHQLNQDTGEGFEVEIKSEGARFNPNVMLMSNDTSLLRSIFIDWGLTLEEAQALTDALTDWVDDNDEVSLNGAEETYYNNIGRINQPFNRPFYNLEEMRLVRGMDQVERLKPDWRDWFSVWSGGKLDVNEASAELIAAAAECAVEVAKVIPQTVAGPDGIRGTDDDVPFQSAEDALVILGSGAAQREDILARFTANDPTTRIESTGYASGAKRKITVIVGSRTGRPSLYDRIEEIVP